MTITWFDGIRIQVLAGFSAADGEFGVWGTGLWGTATWGPDTVFTDVSEWVRSIDTDRQFSRELTEWNFGQATVVLGNQDGRFSPSNMAGPYVVGGITGIRPWRPIVVNVEDVPIFTGYAIAWREVYEQGSPGGGGASVVVQCVDEQAALARVDGSATVSQGGGEPAGERIHRILDNAGHAGLRAVDVGRVTVQPTTHESNTVGEMKLVTDSEGGALYVAADGAVTFEDRYYLVEADRSRQVQATFGDGGWQSTLDLPGAAGAIASTPDRAEFAVTDLDVRVHLAMDDWTPGGFGQFLAGQWPNVGGNNGWVLAVLPAGGLRLTFTTDGSTALDRDSTDPTSFTDGTDHWVRATLDADNGATGHTVQFWTSGDGQNWTLLGAPVITAGTVTLFNSTGPLAVGDVLPLAARVRHVELRDSIDGGVVANPDFTLQIDGTTSFADTSGNTWTVAGTAAIVDDTTVPAELPYSDISISYDGDNLVNIVSLSRAQTPDEQESDIDPPVVTVQDVTSRALYGDSRYTRTDLINDADADLGGLAEFYLAAHKDAELRVDEIVFKPRNSQFGSATRDRLIAEATGRRIRDKIRVIRRPPGGDTIVRDCHVSGISHTITSQGDWRVRFGLWSASVYDTFETSFWDSGLWDEAVWFF